MCAISAVPAEGEQVGKDSMGAGHPERPGSLPEPSRAAEQGFDLDRTHAALLAAGLGVWEFDPTTGDTVRSGAHDAIHGYPLGYPGRWDAATALAHIHEEDRETVATHWAAAVARGAEVHLLYRIRRAGDGTIRWVEARGAPRRDTGAAPLRYLGSLADVTEHHQRDEQRELLLSEMRHRVRNILANVQSLALNTGRRARSVEDFLAAFGGRLTALAQAQDLTDPARGGAAGATVTAVAEAALEPWRGSGQIRLLGSGRRISPRQAVALSLALHELATNAVKYGALSRPEGEVLVAAEEIREGWVTLRWQETGGPAPRPSPNAFGFGSRLLLQALPQELSGQVSRSMPAEGVRCVLCFPFQEAAG